MDVEFIPDDEFFIPEADGFELVFEPDPEFLAKLEAAEKKRKEKQKEE